jgi:cation-transporting P-type ATPase E
MSVAVSGLTREEVADRKRRGLVNDVPETNTRTVKEILRANIVTPFNAVLGSLLAVILVVGPLRDALFGIVLVANALTGIVQELRAKRTLDRLTVLTAPRARVIRDGETNEIGISEVVLDDALTVGPGEQIVVDGEVLEAGGLEIDESLVTGESEPVAKSPRDSLLSGSFVAAGNGVYRATRVGKEAYARALAEEARKFTLVHSELRTGLNRIVRVVGLVMVPTAALLLYSQLRADQSVSDALRGTVAGVVGMVPEGLILLTSIAFAMGVVRLARQKVLVQELPAVETLARVDVVCLDKTGTITSGKIAVKNLEPVASNGGERAALGALAAAEPNPNATLQAIAVAFPSPDGWKAEAVVPFSSARRWSGADFGDRGTWVLGAPETILEHSFQGRSLTSRVEEHAVAGRRVVILSRTSERLRDDNELPDGLEVAGLVILEDEVRPEAPETVAYFERENVELKVISGDHPRTVSAVAARARVPRADAVMDARELPPDDGALADALERHAVFGRVDPHQKRAMVGALQSRRHVVAMTGDGVNDVLALKDADIGVAMGSGSSASRGASQLVLLDDSFAPIPRAVGEGRRVINNIERVANLFLTKTVYSALLALAIGVVGMPFPFLPRHLTLIGSVTIGIPAFFLALAPSAERAHPGFVPRVLRFAIPAGTLAAVATFSAYYLASGQPDVTLAQATTTATLVLAAIGLRILSLIARPLVTWKKVLLAAVASAFVVVLAVPAFLDFFALQIPPPIVFLAAVGILGLVELAFRGAETAVHFAVERRARQAAQTR